MIRNAVVVVIVVQVIGNSVAIRVEVLAFVRIVDTVSVGVVVKVIRNSVIVVIVIQVIGDSVAVGVLQREEIFYTPLRYYNALSYRREPGL